MEAIPAKTYVPTIPLEEWPVGVEYTRALHLVSRLAAATGTVTEDDLHYLHAVLEYERALAFEVKTER